MSTSPNPGHFIPFLAGMLGGVAVMWGLGSCENNASISQIQKDARTYASVTSAIDQVFAVAGKGLVYAQINGKKCALDIPKGLSQAGSVYMACPKP